MAFDFSCPVCGHTTEMDNSAVGEMGICPKCETEVKIQRGSEGVKEKQPPTPDDDPFVSVGDEVKKGQTLCIIEAMKIMNEIESEFDGTIINVKVNNGDPVEYNQSLFEIKPS